MAVHNEIGQLGEKLAADFLAAAGYTILERNWRVNRIELDIIAQLDETLIFVEVKTRTNTDFGQPESFVTKRKMRLMASGATAYMEAVQHEWALRFDVISVILLPKQSPQINHFPDAFFPGVGY